MKLKELEEVIKVANLRWAACKPSEVEVVIEVPGDQQRILYHVNGAYYDVGRRKFVVEVL